MDFQRQWLECNGPHCQSPKGIFFFFHPFHHWHYIRFLVTRNKHFQAHWRYLVYRAYSPSMKHLLQTGRTWGMTACIPAFMGHLMLGSRCLVSTMIKQMSRHSLFSVQVYDLPFYVTYTHQTSISPWSNYERLICQAFLYMWLPGDRNAKCPEPCKH